jgi:tetratricopeptide (TPR) repeat protein
LEEQVQWGIRLSQTNRLCCLHLAYGILFELFYLEPRGLVYEMRRYPTNAFNPPPLLPTVLTNNEAFWNRTIETAADPLQALIADFEHPQRGLRKQLMDFAHLEMPAPVQLHKVAQSYALALNSWGVTLQRNGRLREAARCFERAQNLNPGNLAADISFQCNSHLLAGRKLTVAQSTSIEEPTGRHRSISQLVAEDGPVDDPSFCFQLGLVFAQNRLFRQSCQQLDRVKTLVSGDVALLAEIRADPRLQPLAPAAEKEMTSLEAEAWFNALRATHQQLRVNPDDISALVNEGIILSRLGAWSNAIPPFTRVLALTNSPVALISRANAYLSISNLAAAQTDYLKLRQAWPKDCRVDYGLGEIAYQRKDTNAAIGHYRDYLANAGAGTDGAKFVAARLKALQQGSP